MKKSLFAFLFFLASYAGQAQNYEPGSLLLSGGVGFGGVFGLTYTKQTPAFSIQGEYGFSELGPGVLGGGLYFGTKSYQYSFNDGLGYKWDEKWKYTVVGARAVWHYTELDKENLDVYGGVMLSYNSVNYSFTTNAPQNYYGNYSTSSIGSGIGTSAFIGLRYYPAPKVGLFGELGYGISYLTAGVTLKLK
jgi:hypothetical protein